MRADAASHTAADNALVRALDARRPGADRIADDHLAVHFLPAGYRVLVEAARIPLVRRVAEVVIDAGWPGPRRGVVARTRYIDELIERSAPSIDQVLLLGAGFDTRAYRLSALRYVPVFEVDHPSTQGAKRRVLDRVVDAASHVRFAPVDFLTDDVREVLLTVGFGQGARTFVLWEGVTNYLDAAAVDATFAFIAEAVAPGSPVVFTYVDVAMIEETVSFDGARESKRRVGRQGEPFTFGLNPVSVPTFLRERGFEVLDDFAVPALVKRYYGVTQTSYAYYHVVDARRS
jgi:methyltransferase (TIGR00027 family)